MVILDWKTTNKSVVRKEFDVMCLKLKIVKLRNKYVAKLLRNS